ncbi:glycosyltransferase family 4 protein [Candidatus Uhrbacteria bacterium]|nr:glycosyltransferase family 4 protein [Candidatus Uhrbacteria bacterium]
MRIGIDVRALQWQAGGVQEYTRHVVRALLASEKRHQYVLFGNAWRGTPPLDFPAKGPFHKTCYLRNPNKLLHASLVMFDRPRIDNLIHHHTGVRVDLMFYPNIHFIANSPNCASVVTMHDLSYHHCPDLYSRKSRFWHRIVRPRTITARATHIIAVSNATRNDLIASYGIDGSTITVTPLDCAEEFKDRRHGGPHRVRDVILLFGADHLRKNAEGLREAFLTARARSTTLQKYTLVLIGRGMTRARSHAALRHEGIVHRELVSRHERIDLYQRAALIAFPSFMEGFGIPLLEAAHMRVPIVCANHSSIGEVIGMGAYYVNPYNTRELAKALIDILTDTALATSLTNDAYAAASSYSWDRTASITRSVFEKVL